MNIVSQAIDKAVELKDKVVDFFVGEEVSSSMEPITADGDENRKEAPMTSSVVEEKIDVCYYDANGLTNGEILRAGSQYPGIYVRDGIEYMVVACPPSPFEKVSKYVMCNGVKMPIDTTGDHRPLPLPTDGNAKNLNVKGEGDVSGIFMRNEYYRTRVMRTTTWGHKLSPRR